jgi:hypothetical protein
MAWCSAVQVAAGAADGFAAKTPYDPFSDNLRRATISEAVERAQQSPRFCIWGCY